MRFSITSIESTRARTIEHEVDKSAGVENVAVRQARIRMDEPRGEEKPAVVVTIGANEGSGQVTYSPKKASEIATDKSTSTQNPVAEAPKAGDHVRVEVVAAEQMKQSTNGVQEKKKTKATEPVQSKVDESERSVAVENERLKSLWTVLESMDAGDRRGHWVNVPDRRVSKQTEKS